MVCPVMALDSSRGQEHGGIAELVLLSGTAERVLLHLGLESFVEGDPLSVGATLDDADQPLALDRARR